MTAEVPLLPMMRGATTIFPAMLAPFCGWGLAMKLITTWLGAGSVAAENPTDASPLPGTAPLTWDDDIASRLVDGVDRFLLDELHRLSLQFLLGQFFSSLGLIFQLLSALLFHLQAKF